MTGDIQMHRTIACCILSALFVACHASRLCGQAKDELADYRAAGLKGGDPARGKVVFESDEAACKKCHVLKADERLAGPGLAGHRRQVRARATDPGGAGAECHDPSRLRHDRRLDDGWQGPHGRPAQANRRRAPAARRGRQARAPARRRDRAGAADRHVADARRAAQDVEARAVRRPDRLSRVVEATGWRVAVRGHAERDSGDRKADPARAAASDAMRFDHPVWIIAIPGSKGAYLVVEQKTRKIWRFEEERAPEGAVRRLQPAKRRPANSRAWSASRSIRVSSRTASTT